MPKLRMAFRIDGSERMERSPTLALRSENQDCKYLTYVDGIQ